MVVRLIHWLFEGSAVPAVDGDWLRAGAEVAVAELALVFPLFEVQEGCDLFVFIEHQLFCLLCLGFAISWLFVRFADAHVLEVLFQARCLLRDVKGLFWRLDLDLVINDLPSGKLLELQHNSFLHRPEEVQDLEQLIFGITHSQVFQSQVALDDVQRQLPEL